MYTTPWFNMQIILFSTIGLHANKSKYINNLVDFTVNSKIYNFKYK